MKLSITSILSLLLPFLCAAEELYDCAPDATGQFYVEGTQGNGMRYCAWAARNHTEERCKIEVVAWQCPVTCQVPCIDRDGNGAVIGAAVFTPRAEKKAPVSLIITGSLFGLVAIAALVGFGMRRNGNREVDYEEDYDRDFVDENEVMEDDLPEPIEPTRQSSISTEVVTKNGPSCCDPC
eukprot:CAMPEP_0176498022 /NCGR_PEP_ID=MMETSP0200_2-20121128/12069_1 /TAXON_ID=947934 /ORGANISM="Chaetoceros sp., Strain GSL56" /LENGTH=179 /DNA_ID=CAMNT_0017896141 /DNA_START=90 /DNA_END=629 /DNA_ORIENTATION=-